MPSEPVTSYTPQNAIYSRWNFGIQLKSKETRVNPLIALETGILAADWRSASAYAVLHATSGSEICVVAGKVPDISNLITQRESLDSAVINTVSRSCVRRYWRNFDLFNISIADEFRFLEIRQRVLEIALEGRAFGLDELFLTPDRVTGAIEGRRFIMRSPSRLAETIADCMISFVRDQLTIAFCCGFVSVRFARRLVQTHLCIDLREVKLVESSQRLSDELR